MRSPQICQPQTENLRVSGVIPSQPKGPRTRSSRGQGRMEVPASSLGLDSNTILLRKHPHRHTLQGVLAWPEGGGHMGGGGRLSDLWQQLEFPAAADVQSASWPCSLSRFTFPAANPRVLLPLFSAAQHTLSSDGSTGSPPPPGAFGGALRPTHLLQFVLLPVPEAPVFCHLHQLRHQPWHPEAWPCALKAEKAVREGGEP